MSCWQGASCCSPSDVVTRVGAIYQLAGVGLLQVLTRAHPAPAAAQVMSPIHGHKYARVCPSMPGYARVCPGMLSSQVHLTLTFGGVVHTSLGQGSLLNICQFSYWSTTNSTHPYHSHQFVLVTSFDFFSSLDCATLFGLKVKGVKTIKNWIVLLLF